MTLLTIPAPRLPAAAVAGVRLVAGMGDVLPEDRAAARRERKRLHQAAYRARNRDAVNARRAAGRALRGREADGRSVEERRAADRASYARNRRVKLARLAAKRLLARVIAEAMA